MFNLWSFRGLEALVSSGLGGGSLIYANVLLRKDERWFVNDLPNGGYESWALDRKALDGAFDRLVIAAAPIALGNFRKQLSDHSKKLVLAELDKDLTNLPTPQLNKHFDGIIAV